MTSLYRARFPSRDRTSQVRCLIADDDVICAKTVAAGLRAVAEVTMVGDGRAAILAVEQAYLHGVPYHLLLMDIYMPGIDGLAAIRAIRTMESSRASQSTLHIAIATVARSPQLIQQHVGGLIDAYLVKPVDRRQLLRRMQEWGLIAEVPNDPQQEDGTALMKRRTSH